MKCQDLFSLKKKKGSSAAVVIGVLRVNIVISSLGKWALVDLLFPGLKNIIDGL